MGDEEAATLDGQFVEFARYLDTQKRRDGKTITLYRQDFWMRQAKVLDDRKLTMTDTGVVWFKWCKTELDWDEWYQFMTEVCELREIDQEFMEISLTNCGLPGSCTVIVPQYRDFFDTYKPRDKMVIKTELDWDEWYQFMTEVCELREIDQEFMEISLTNCGLPGSCTVIVPQYRDFFDTYKPRDKMVM